ncbi:hypothetical protein F4677DRAFT_336033 [Hypoxylon crocopeplum]|nr:hypothetical protein F4677DRAFT_336033 [Hypoxylon crocopeplum]
MSSEPVTLRLDEVPTIPSSIDPISTTSTICRPLISGRVDTVLPDRTRSLNADGEWRGRSASPSRANKKRGRSVASAPGGSVGGRLLRRNSSTRTTDSDNSHSHGGAAQKQRSLPRGRSARRATPYSDQPESRKSRKVDDTHEISSEPTAKRSRSIKRLLKVTKGLERPLVAQLPLSGNVESDEQATYERKGAFRLKSKESKDEFRFPTPKSQPEPLWHAGDGFSGDEAKPGFIFSMTGTHKPTKPQSLPGIGKLQLESAEASKDDPRGSGTSNPKPKSSFQYAIKRRRGVAKDVWPTRKNFAEELQMRQRNPTAPDPEKVISSTVPLPSTPEPQAREALKYIQSSQRERKPLDFESFGQRLLLGELSCVEDKELLNTDPSELGDYEEYEYERLEGEEDEGLEEGDYEEEEDDEPGTAVSDRENGYTEEYIVSYDGKPSPSLGQSRGPSPGGSALSTLEDEEPKPQEAKQGYNDIWAMGDVARQVLLSSQALT